MKYQFECRIDDDIYYEFNKYVMLYPNGKKQRFLLLKLIVPILFLFRWLTDFFSGMEIDALFIMFILLTIISILWILAVKPLSLWELKRRIKRLKKKKDKLYAENAIVEFYDDCFIDKSEISKEEIKYEAIIRVCDNDGKGIYLFKNSILAYIIPYAAFRSDCQRMEFIDFIKEKTGKVCEKR